MSPFSSDGGGEESDSGGVWSHIGEGARRGEAHARVVPTSAVCGAVACVVSSPPTPLVLSFLQIARLQAVRVEMMQKALVQWCEKQLVTARDGLQQFSQHLESFRGMTWWSLVFTSPSTRRPPNPNLTHVSATSFTWSHHAHWKSKRVQPNSEA